MPGMPEALKSLLLEVRKFKARPSQRKLQPKNLLEISELEVRVTLLRHRDQQTMGI